MKIAYKNWKCDKCDLVFDTRNLLGLHKHEQHQKQKYNWKCTVCNAEFTSRHLMQAHRKEQHTAVNDTSKHAGHHPIINASCKFCNRICKTKSALTKHENCCKLNPNRVKYKGHTFSEADKIKISNSMKLAISEGRAKGWASSKQNKNGMSYPEVWFTQVIDNEFEDKHYEYNMQFFKYKLDFAWKDKKKCIEIDGSQHELEERKLSDELKDKLLEEHGWNVLRLSWRFICNNTQEAINIAKEFIHN